MQALFTKTIEDPEEHILKYSLTYLNLKKIPDDKIDKVRSDDNMEAIQRFLDVGGMFMYLFALNMNGIPKYVTDPPTADMIKQKMVLVIRARPPKSKEEPVEINM